jgi:bifunctional DNA-binding transcriptional regulator/antitoxin component of YhaV-PrlF toxin-antitoxin module
MTVIVKNKTPLVAPTSVRRRAGLKSGDKLEFRVSGGVITILPKPAAGDISDENTPAQRELIDRAIAEGLEDIKHGRLQGPFSSHKEFITSLHQEARKLNAKKPKRPVR